MPSSSSSKVARRFYAAFFNVGDVILFGRWKNKKGRITAFGQDAKGNPTVTIEPIPKGRKKNKTFSLFKIWRVPSEKVAMSIRARVVARFKQAAIEVGRSFEIGNVRIHRFRDHYRVWDLTDAGKRGKKVRVMTISPTHYYAGDPDKWMEDTSKIIGLNSSYDEILRLYRDVQKDYPKEIAIEEYTEKAVDVSPAGTTKITLTTPQSIEIRATPLDWGLTSTAVFDSPDGGTFKQNTLYYPRGKKNVARFYNWLKSNLSQANKMTISDFRKLWDDLEIPYDYH